MARIEAAMPTGLPFFFNDASNAVASVVVGARTPSTRQR